ncbi:hypothetical protein PBY51_022207 [Eleginops maclovinus]|uniref:Uncharacterized protein n=1 Tax=Eleginops maclovinus TaxID=56733 RepID=A0AAN7XGK8_ELEMC|nr:hypothetical protein PBY51_022207 [Eleginops maclovinus]
MEARTEEVEEKRQEEIEEQRLRERMEVVVEENPQLEIEEEVEEDKQRQRLEIHRHLQGEDRQAPAQKIHERQTQAGREVISMQRSLVAAHISPTLVLFKLSP